MNRLSKFWIFNEPPSGARTNALAARQHPGLGRRTAAAPGQQYILRRRGRAGVENAPDVPPILADGRSGPSASQRAYYQQGFLAESVVFTGCSIRISSILCGFADPD
jgi:hypothetical protein